MTMQMCFFIINVWLCCSHLFAIANLSYTTMMDAKKDQCIVIRYDMCLDICGGKSKGQILNGSVHNVHHPL